MLGFFGQYLVENGLIDYLQLDLGLAFMSERNRRFGELAVAQGLLTVDKADALHERQKTVDKYFGELAVEDGFFAESEIQRLLDEQRREHLRIGEALVELGLVDKQQVEQAFKGFAAEQAAATSLVSLLPAGPFESIAAYLKSNLPRRFQRAFGEPAKLGGTEPHRPMARFELQAMLEGAAGLCLGLDVQRRWLRGMQRSLSRDSEAFIDDTQIKELATGLLRLVSATAAAFEGENRPVSASSEPQFGELPLYGTAMSLITPHGRALLVLSSADS